MELHKAIEAVLRDAGGPLHVRDIAAAIDRSGLYQRGDGGPLPTAQVHARIGKRRYRDSFVQLGDGVIELATRHAGLAAAMTSAPESTGATVSTVSQIDALYGPGAAKWVWTAKPAYAFEVDGRDREILEPVADPLHGDEEDRGWWTCDPQTRAGDLAVVYRSATPINEPGCLPRRGPKDLRQVILALSDAFALASDPLAGEFADKHGCRYMPVSALAPSVSIALVRTGFAPSRR